MVLRVLHLTGSPTSEFHADLSIRYAADCLAATADPERYEFHVAHVSPDGRWRFPSGLSGAELGAAPPVGLPEAVARIAELRPDVALPQLFCIAGMTSYRALLEVLGVPFVGNLPGVMALAADKAATRAVVAAAGVDVPPGELLRPGEAPRLAPPAVVKPVDADNSFGVGLVESPDGWPAALASAFEHSDRVLAERYVELGREVRCGVLERDGELVCLPLEEYRHEPGGRSVRTHADKLGRGPGGELTFAAKTADRAWSVPADDPATAPVHAAARLAHRALGCRHYSLFDFRIDPAGRPWFLEAGLYNSFAPASVLATMAAAAGTPLSELFADSLRAAR